jgi:hypothetical protein
MYNDQGISNLKTETKDNKAADAGFIIACDGQFTRNNNS